jgi:hypothetical protein
MTYARVLHTIKNGECVLLYGFPYMLEYLGCRMGFLHVVFAIKNTIVSS